MSSLENKLITIDRDSLLQFLNTVLQKDAESGLMTGLLLLKVNQFRRISVTYGYDRTQQLLAMLKQGLASQLPKKDAVFYLGRDEFIIILKGLGVPEQLDLAINKVQRIMLEPSLCEPFIFMDTSLRMRLTLGATVTQGKEVTSEELFFQANKALLQGIEHAENAVKYVPEEHDESSLPSLELQSHLERALAHKELKTVFQPKTELLTGKVVSVESLARWNSKAFGPVRPDIFIDAAEKSGLIMQLVNWSISNAARQYNKWGDNALPIAVNLSAAVINHPELFRQIQHSLSIWSMPAEALTLEITETAVMDSPEQSLETLKKFSDMGIRLSIDDFGTGYSSLSYLKHLPVDELKIDKSFVSRLATDESDRKIVKSVVDLAHNFNLKVVAEGIEDIETYQILLELGCEVGQGYLMSRPLPPDELITWLQEDAWYRPQSESSDYTAAIA